MMKRYILTAAGLALCLGASANVAVMGSGMKGDNKIQTAQAESLVKVMNQAAPFQAPARAMTAEDVEGYYEWLYFNHFNPDDTPYGGDQSTLLTITMGDKDGEYLIDGYKGLTWKATADLSAGTFTIPGHQFAFKTDEGKDIYLEFQKWIPDNDGDGYYDGREECSEMVGMLTENGIEFDPLYIIGLPNPAEENSFYGPLFASGNQMLKMKMFEFNPEEWNSVGKASYNDGWQGPRWYEDPQNEQLFYEVDAYTNKKQPSLICLANVYGANTPFAEVNVATEPGYILIDTSDPDLVIVKNQIYSGFSDEDNGGFYNYNLEGFLFYVQGVELEEVYNRLDGAGYEISNLNGDEIKIYNCLFGISADMDAGYAWQDQAGNGIEMTTTVRMPEGWTNGVESVEFDSNAPVQYFNLQGVEVANPEAGQIVIKKQGSKAVKVVVK